MSTRKLESRLVRIGWQGLSERARLWHNVKCLMTFPANSPHGRYDAAGILFESETRKAAIMLTDTGAVELIKGLLMLQLNRPIIMAADDEFRNILKQVIVAMDDQDETARQVARAITGQNRPQITESPTTEEIVKEISDSIKQV